MGKMKNSDHLIVGKDIAGQKLSNTSKKRVNMYSNTGEELHSRSEKANSLHPGNSISRYSPQENSYMCRIFTAAYFITTQNKNKH